jgi:ribosomal protein L29
MRKENEELFLSIEALRECTDSQLEAVIVEAQQRQYEIINQSMHGNQIDIEQPHQLKALRKQIARCNTIMNEKIF